MQATTKDKTQNKTQKQQQISLSEQFILQQGSKMHPDFSNTPCT